MKGKHEKTGKKTTFANLVISVVVVVAVLVTAAVVWEYHRLRTVMPAGVISALFAFWGGELLIVALRQIFGSDVTRSKPPEAESEPAEKMTAEATQTGTQQDILDTIFGGHI